MLYIDTSVLVAYYCPEPLSAKAQTAIREADCPTISPLVEAEFASGLSIKIRTGQMDRTDAERVLATFRLHVADGSYRILMLDTEHFLLAADWIGRFATPLRTLDALHMAVAFAADLTLLTADQALGACARHFGVANRVLP